MLDVQPPWEPYRFWSKVQKTGGCWLWTGRTSHRYGAYDLSGDGPPRHAHRVAWELTGHHISADYDLHHLCDNPLCVNPDHLEPLTRQCHWGWTSSITDIGKSGLIAGASCYVEQGRYGLPVKKATWLYAYGCELPELRWGFTPDGKGEEPNGPMGGLENWRDRFGRIDGWRDKHAYTEDGKKIIGGYWKTGHGRGCTAATPVEFRDVLLGMARTAAKVPA